MAYKTASQNLIKYIGMSRIKERIFYDVIKFILFITGLYFIVFNAFDATIGKHAHHLPDNDMIYDIQESLDSIDSRLYDIQNNTAYILSSDEKLDIIESDISRIKWNTIP